MEVKKEDDLDYDSVLAFLRKRGLRATEDLLQREVGGVATTPSATSASSTHSAASLIASSGESTILGLVRIINYICL
jgi:hypothetical protein